MEAFAPEIVADHLAASPPTELPPESVEELVAGLSRERARAARLWLRAGCVTEDLLAVMGVVKPETVRAWRSARVAPPHVKVGGVVVYPIGELEQWINRQALGCGTDPRPRPRGCARSAKTSSGRCGR